MNQRILPPSSRQIPPPCANRAKKRRLENETAMKLRGDPYLSMRVSFGFLEIEVVDPLVFCTMKIGDTFRLSLNV